MEQRALKKISDYIWEIPKSYRSDMRVPGRIFASEKILEDILKDESLLQVVNVATLPGIQKYSLAMPDAHEGYGFCLSKDAKVMSEFGYHISIEELEKAWGNHCIKVFESNRHILQVSSIKKFFKIRSRTKIFKVLTRSGRKIIATGDHPFYNKSGMRELSKIREDEEVAIHGFSGVFYEQPSNKLILNEGDIMETLDKLGISQISTRAKIMLRKLHQRGLLPLSYSHPKLPYLIKIAAFIFGDGSMNFIGKKRDGVLHFSGKPEDLESVRRDIRLIGYTPSPIFKSKVKTPGGKIFDHYSFQVNASSLMVLLKSLGVPRGKKVSQPYRLPRWIFKAPLWQKRLFLASLFGCELRMPHRRLNRRGNFNAPVFPMNKSEELIKNGKLFLKDIEKLLADFCVRITKINQRRRHIAKDKLVTYALELIISSEAENLINLWSRIGFEYNEKRAFLASVAAHYLRLKLALLQEKKTAIDVQIPRLLKAGLSYGQIARQLSSNPLSKRFIIDVCWKIRKGLSKIIPRVPPSFPTFSEFLEEATDGLGRNGLVWDKVVSIKEIDFDDYVYDFTVDHPSHNFIANGFLVSNCVGGVAAMDLEDGVISPGGIGFDINCGVRLLKSDKSYEEIKEKIPELATAIYGEVPSGVGRGGRLKLVNKELDEVLGKGVRKMFESGYATEDDLKNCESEGQLKEADADLVSKTAKDRGRDQLGTMGAGNHFVEVQGVDEIFDQKIATQLGLFENQITIMIHCGSRGLGHQVATDHIREMLNSIQKYGIALSDKQLACAPFNSEEGRNYFAAMSAAANFAWANRQFITWEVRKAWESIFGESNSLKLVYDVAHNIAKIEEYLISEASPKLRIIVHRKGATRAFPGQPVLIPGSMGTASYVLIGTEQSLKESFGSSCHGAGRVMSRTRAKREVRGSILKEELEKKGISIRSGSMSGLAEEAPIAYKDVEEVVGVVHNLGLAKKVARLKPAAVIKG